MAHVKENERSLDNRDATSAVTETLGDDSCAALNENDSKTSDMPEEFYCTSGGLAAALRSVASSQLWNLIGFSVPPSSFLSMYSQESASQLNSSSMHLEVNTLQEEYLPKYESEYINVSVPLYQEYWMNSVRKDLHRAKQKGLSELVASIHLPGLKTPPPSGPSSASSPSDQQVKSYALWQELPQAKDLLNSLTAREIQLQEAMFELIVSEASYQKSLVVAVNVFQCSAELKQTLSRVEHHALFSNLKEVCRVSERFLQDLESHLKQDVVMSQAGDIVLNHQKSFQQVYVPYITNMMYQEALITRLLYSNKKFALILKKLEKDPLCQRQTLKSFLILPFQRITRMTLLLENILKRVGGLCLNVSHVKEAIEAVRKIVTECDRNVQQMKSTEFLVCLHKFVDFRSVKSIPLITRGRHMLQEGPLKQLILGGNHKVSVVSRKDVYIHLFNDLLLLSLKSGQRFIVQDHALFPANVHAEGIKTEIFGLPPDSFLLHLTKNHNKSSTSIILAARTRLEKETWIKRLSSDSKNEMP
ncbi:putative rho guanine nucleotide exchange factor 19 [Triplophysa rosa]|uniref:Rho guanine nucleotide exchange factor 19 n=1 Tax=Triplophysa rosa TaxID=992332 RepID=A0A9W7WSI9_TRIRA|nr:putative rho guanine nucleotide exchange factor 19 [Triplophysa rosa]